MGKIYRKLLLTVAMLVTSLSLFANHLVGMDLFYTHVTGNTYQITLIAYADCGSASSTSAFAALSTNTPTIHIYDGGSFVSSVNLAINVPTGGLEITPVCPSFLSLTQCTDPTFVTPGIKKFVYTGLYTLPYASSVWRFIFTGSMGSGALAGRALSITNISTVPVSYIQLVDTLNNLSAPNSNVSMTNIPTPFYCNGTSSNYNPGAVDPNGDALRFSLVNGANGTTSTVPGGGVTYLAPYTGSSPLDVSALSFDNTTGQITFTPASLQRSLVVYNIREFRGGTFVGSCQREMTFLVQPCTNTPPNGNFSSASAGVITDNTHMEICQNSGPFTLNIAPFQAVTTNNIYVSTSGLPAGLTFTTTGNGTPTPTCVISWTSTGVAPGSYTFYVTYSDNNCPLSGTQTIAYTITILPQPTITQTLLSAATCLRKAAISIAPGGGGSPWIIKVSRGASPFDTIQTFSFVTGSFTDSLLPGSYTITAFSSSAGCRASVPVTIATPSFPTPSVALTNPSFCGNNDGVIKLSGLWAGTVDTVRFNRNGVAQPPQVHTVAADGTITITGLIAGSYTNIVVKYGNCSSPAIGPFGLVNPPFTMRALSKVDPTFCGSCAGTVTLYGLRPGQIDTITYWKDGVLQPAISQLIGPDSTVVITGLCAGTYTNFVARTAGSCVSNALGPVVLAAPPFTARAVTFTNPPYCGFCTGTMTIWGLRPGQTDTVYYWKDGIPQAPVVRTIGTDSTATITGLCVGTYSNIVVRTAGVCVSNTLGPITLTVPPFTARAITFVNPPYCGICTGSITIYGLYPGQTDTIRYTKDGVLQPAVVRTIGADSTAVLSGLCAGVYDNIVVRTAGVCVSNTLGPANLTVPAFTMRASNHTNPDFCGICNGVIRLYGLYPGQTDSVYFRKDGVMQPPRVQLIGADSIFTISGLCAGNYTDIVVRTAGVCVSNTLGPELLTVPPFTMSYLTYTNPPYCGICTGTIKVHGLYPGQTDTIIYKKDGVTQPPFVAVVAGDSTVTITGLCAGVYDEFVARTGGVCVSNMLGPVTLTVPPFTMRALAFVNPPYCGICTGKIKLYGLYPGQTDSIYFTKDGMMQPPVVRTVAADSTIEITGLCAGLYDNIVARTGGVCVSNTLGPANLTVPPFTMRAVAALNPTKCGYCDGEVRLYGLYPGQIDTIYYNKDGVPQTPVVFNIGPDSTVRITDLCQGTYNNFVARTGGVCVSNMLGPVTLVHPPIIPDFSFSIAKDCGADTVAFLNLSAPAADLTYVWTFGDGDSSTTTNPTHIYTMPAIYKTTLHITNGRCLDSIKRDVPITNIVKASFTALPDSFVCTSVPVAFTNTSLGFNMSYVWAWGDGTGSTQKDDNHAWNRTGTYKVMMAVTNDVPCFDTAYTYITVDSLSGAYIALTDSVLCGGKTITFTADYAKSGNEGILWTFGDGSSVANVNPVIHGYNNTGQMTVRLDAFYRACPDTFATHKIWVIDPPQVYLGGDAAICPGSNPITLGDKDLTNIPGARWLWSTGARTSDINVVTPGNYWVRVTVGGCTATDSITVKQDCYIDVPNAFTPNGDGVNDYFLPRPLLAKGLTSFTMSVYNRWGQLIFETDKIEGRGWDGRYNGAPQPEGVYVFMIDAKFKDGQIEKRQGNVTLLR